MKRFTAARTAAFAFVAALVSVSAGVALADDAPKGQEVFEQCSGCHALDHVVVGPPLAGVVGRKAGSVAGFSYSPLMKAAGDAGLVWTQDEIVDYLQNPTDYLKAYLKSKGKEASGASMMYFMLADEDQRKAVAAYLASQK